MSAPLTQSALERAIENNGLLLFYQPKVCLLTGEIVGAEALVRLKNEDQNIVMPSDFIPLAQKSGLLHDITVSLLDQLVSACQSIRDVRSGLSLSINVAANDLESHTISGRIEHYLAEQSIVPSELEIEITESAAMNNLETITEDLERLSAMKVKLLMDDFGTGYSSIDRLSKLPFDRIKMDQGVVKRMGTSRQNMNVVKSTISMARELRMTSIAEGVESAAEYNFLIANGCEEAQGYFIAKPMAFSDFKVFIDGSENYDGSQIGRVHQALFNIVHYRKCLLDAAFCISLNKDSVLPSVMSPDVTLTGKDSRFGVWYYGLGQGLVEMENFRRIEEPLEKLHVLGQRFIEDLGLPVSHTELNGSFVEIDECVDTIVVLLHALERDLLLH